MIIAIGTDIVDNAMTEKLHWKDKPGLLKRIFTEEELNIFNKSKSMGMQFLYGRFAVKEAVLKCLGTGMIDGLPMTDIQTLRGPEGQPVINLQGRAHETATEKNITNWHVSISNCESYTIAFVIAESIY